MPREYVVWSNEHNRWWGPGRMGYVSNLRQAGRYSREEALDICANALGGWIPGDPLPEVPVRFEDAEQVEARAMWARRQGRR